MSEHTGTEIESSLHSDGAKGLIRLTADYGSSTEVVWAAITDPKELALWYGRVEGDLREGGDFSAFISAVSGMVGVTSTRVFHRANSRSPNLKKTDQK